MAKVDKTTEKQPGGATGKGFMPGQSGNPNGRPKGARNKLSEDFLNAMHEDFKEHGIAAIQEVRQTNSAAYLKVIASIVPKEIKGEIKHEHRKLTDLELAHELITVLTSGAEGQDSPVNLSAQALMDAFAGPSDGSPKH